MRSGRAAAEPGACGIVLIAAGGQYQEAAHEQVTRLLYTFSRLPAGCTSLNVSLYTDRVPGRTEAAQRVQRIFLPPMLRELRFPSAQEVDAPSAACAGAPSWASCHGFQGGDKMHLRTLALLSAAQTYDYTLLLDLDAYPCHGWQVLFEHLTRTKADVAAAVEINPFGSTGGNRLLPGPSDDADGTWARLPELNTGLVLLRTRRRKVRHFLRTWAKFNAEARTGPYEFSNDQYPFRRAVYEHRAALRVRRIPHTEHCRRHDDTPCVAGCRVRHGKARRIRQATPHLVPGDAARCRDWGSL